MANEEEFIAKLKKWVEDNPENADATHINLTTQKEFTIRGILNQLVSAKEDGAAVLDKHVLEVKGQIEQWIKGK